MYIFLSILIGLFTILFLITLHEFAHFVLAKLAGAYVYEFAIGMGPKIWQWGKNETRYTLRLLPLGGYVSIASELADAPKGREDEIVNSKRMIENLHRGKKAAFISAGALLNLLLAFILLMIGYGIYPQKNDLNSPPTYATRESSLYDAVNKHNEDNKNKPNSQILENDKITEISIIEIDNSKKSIKSYKDLKEWLKKFNFKKNAELKTYKIIFNDDKNKTVTFKPKIQNDKLIIGVTPIIYVLSSTNVFTASIVDTFENSYRLIQELGKLVIFQSSNIQGAVGIVKSTSNFLNSNLSSIQATSQYFRWASSMSANLFLLNMLPIPPLDGYKFVENVVEAVKRKKLNPKYKIIVNVAGASLFLLIFVVTTIKDIFFS